uniref:ASCH domain-containing protein n=1 Tax=Rhabditophanes sp. KR3021 TaxID=114890 RepID=A0AC35U0J6_9BILA
MKKSDIPTVKNMNSAKSAQNSTLFKNCGMPQKPVRVKERWSYVQVYTNLYNKKVKWDLLVDEEKARDKVLVAGKGMIVLKKTYASEDYAFNIEDILIDYWSETITNSDFRKPTYDIVKKMFPGKKDQVGQLILQEFLDVKEKLS